MKKYPKLIPVLLSFFALLFTSIHAQSPSDQDDDEIVRLSPFAVEESSNMGRYQAVEASSGNRIRMNLMDSPQSISVMTSEFIADVGAGKVLDAAKYMSGLGVGSNPDAFDLINVRGFLTGNATIDGFRYGTWMNQDPAIIERLEIIKGPNAILSPSGHPGGMLNLVTKKPLFTDTKRGHISYQAGRYNSNRAEVDGNYIVRPGKIAVRMVAAVTDTDSHVKHKFSQNVTAMPSLTYRFSPGTELTAQLYAYNATVLDSGAPMSLYAVGRSNIRLLEGTPSDFGMIGRNTTRHENMQILNLLFTSQITDKLSTRIAGQWATQHVRASYMGPSFALDTAGNDGEVVKLNQITGEWEWDGVTRNDNPRYLLSGSMTKLASESRELQHDFVYEHSGRNWKSQTVAGYIFRFNASSGEPGIAYVDDPTLYDFTDPNYTPPDIEFDYTNLISDRYSNHYHDSHAFVYEVIKLFDDRLVLNGGLSVRRSSKLPSGGVVYKVIPQVALYYGYSKMEVMGAEDPNNGVPRHVQHTEQYEGGVRFRLFDGRLFATLAYFDITQDNIYSEDSRNYITPTPDPRYPHQRSERTSKGFEFELSWSPTKDISVIGSFTDFKNRDGDNRVAVYAAQRMAALWGHYTFPETGPLGGLSVGIGASYVGERPSEFLGTYTSPPPGYDPVPVQSVFWLPSYTLVEANVSYRLNKHWKAQLVVHNLLNKDIILTNYNRTAWTSAPISPKLTIRYDF